MVKEEVERGTRKLFKTTLTDTSGNAQDPDTCQLRFEKVGSVYPNEASGWYSCSKISTTGVWGANVTLSDSMTLGDWLCRFYWVKDNISDHDSFEFVVIRKDEPWNSSRGPVVP